MHALSGKEAQSSLHPQLSFPENLFVLLTNPFNEKPVIYFTSQGTAISSP